MIIVTENKSNLIYALGIGVALFFVYLIIKEQNKTLLSAIKPTLSQPIIQPIVQPDLNISYTNSLQLQQLQLQTQELQSQTKQISEQLQFQTQELQLLHELQLKQQQNISNLESVKCSNVVSMSDNTQLLKIKHQSNLGRENEEYTANNTFGMK